MPNLNVPVTQKTLDALTRRQAEYSAICGHPANQAETVTWLIQRSATVAEAVADGEDPDAAATEGKP